MIMVLGPVHIQAWTLFTPDSSAFLCSGPLLLVICFPSFKRCTSSCLLSLPVVFIPLFLSSSTLTSFSTPSSFPTPPSFSRTHTHVFQTIQPFIFENNSAASTFFHELRSGKKQKPRHCSPSPHLHPNLNRYRVLGGRGRHRKEGCVGHPVLAALPHTEGTSKSQGLREEEPGQQTSEGKQHRR